MRTILFLTMVAFTVQADPIVLTDSDTKLRLHALPTQKLDAIRLIGRNVLLAKRSWEDEAVDKAQVAQLRSTVDQLIATETQTFQTNSIELEKKGTAVSSIHQASDETKRKAARNHAWTMVAKLREGGSLLHSKTKAPAKIEVYSGGLPVGQQRGRLFEKWADKLEATLDDNNPQRLAQLKDLRERLKPEKHGIVEAPLIHETPTFQAIPWEGSKEQFPKKQHKTKSRK